MPAAPSRSVPGLAAVVLVMALHALALLLALRLGVWRDRTAPPREAPGLVVRLLWPALPPAPAPAAPAETKAAARATTARPDDALRRRPVAEPQAITLPSEPATATELPQPPPNAPPPLDLRLRRADAARARSYNPALDDPRSNTPRASIESRIAETLGGSGPVTMERLDDGRLRFRRGSDCVVVHPNRGERLDPFNSSVMPKPRGVEKC